MPLEKEEVFLAKLQKGNRIQIPVVIRGMHKLRVNEILGIEVRSTKDMLDYRDFYAMVSNDGRFVIPKIIVEKLELEIKDMVEITLYPPTTVRDHSED